MLFWICIHYDGPYQERVVRQFDKWNYVDMEELTKQKLDTDEGDNFYEGDHRQFHDVLQAI
jgi:hypothetical protein